MRLGLNTATPSREESGHFVAQLGWAIAEVYNYFRDYDPSTGRYVQSDPLGIQGGLQPFGYASGSPLNRFDTLGLFDVDWRPSTFDQSRHPPQWVIDLRQYGRRLQDRINRLCARDRNQLQPYFDNWVVGYDPLRKDPYTRGNKSSFTDFSFKQDDFKLIFVHEFRHTMGANVRLHRPSTYLGAFVSGKHDDEPDEMDADRFANEIEGSCQCPKFE
jgi:RHS repeat-associated protein